MIYWWDGSLAAVVLFLCIMLVSIACSACHLCKFFFFFFFFFHRNTCTRTHAELLVAVPCQKERHATVCVGKRWLQMQSCPILVWIDQGIAHRASTLPAFHREQQSVKLPCVLFCYQHGGSHSWTKTPSCTWTTSSVPEEAEVSSLALVKSFPGAK